MTDEKTDEGDTGGKGDNTNSKDGDNNENPNQDNINLLDEAKAINEKKEELLNREEELIKRKEKLQAEQMVGGKSIAGQMQSQLTEERKKINKAKTFFKGTALEEAIEKANG